MFNQLTSEEVRTRFVRGHPFLLSVQALGRAQRALDRRVYCVGRTLCAAGALGGAVESGARQAPCGRQHCRLRYRIASALRVVGAWRLRFND
jgi:hypothetical protein